MNRRKVSTLPKTKTIPHTDAYQKDPTDTAPTPPADVPEEAHPNLRIPLRCRRRRSSARPLGPDHSVATFHDKLLLAGPLGPRSVLPLVVATRPQATLSLAGPLCPGPAAVTDDRHRQARTLVRWTKWWCSCCVARCLPLSSSRHSPQNLVCLAELSRSHLSDPSLPALGVAVRV